MRLLDHYFRTVMAVDDIYKSPEVRQFLGTQKVAPKADDCVEEGAGSRAPPPREERGDEGDLEAPGGQLFAEVASAEVDSARLQVELPTGRTLSVAVPAGATVLEAERAVAKVLKLADFSAGVFGLFAPVAKGKFEHKLPDGALVDAAAGALRLRKWLFAKQQEVHMEDDEVALELLVAQAQADLAEGRLQLSDEIKRRLTEVAEAGQHRKYVKAARKLKPYGGMTLRKCVSDYPAPDSKVLVTVDLARLTLHELDAEGAPAEDGGTEFSWDIVIKYERTERTLRITYATDEDGGTEDIEIVSRDADHFEQCVGRVMLERGWLRHVVSGGGPTDNELALAGPRSPRPNFFRS